MLQKTIQCSIKELQDAALKEHVVLLLSKTRPLDVMLAQSDWLATLNGNTITISPLSIRGQQALLKLAS